MGATCNAQLHGMSACSLYYCLRTNVLQYLPMHELNGSFHIQDGSCQMAKWPLASTFSGIGIDCAPSHGPSSTQLA